MGWNGFVNLGMSKPVYTIDNDMAIIEHSAAGEAEIYINGTMVGKMYTPGITTIEIG